MAFVPTAARRDSRKLLVMDEDGSLIPEPECWKLLASASVGRIALSIRALPAILPVQYYLDGHTLAVCLGHRELPERTLNAVVAFAADAIEPQTRSGWSVQVQGQSAITRQLRIDTACGWPVAAQVVQIEPTIISGYRMHLCPFIDSLLAGKVIPGSASEAAGGPLAL